MRRTDFGSVFTSKRHTVARRHMPPVAWYHYKTLSLRLDHLITWLHCPVASVSRHNGPCLDLCRRSSTNPGQMSQLMQISGGRVWRLPRDIELGGNTPGPVACGRAALRPGGRQEAWPGVSPPACLQCHPSLGLEPSRVTSHWAAGFDQTSLQHLSFQALLVGFGYNEMSPI